MVGEYDLRLVALSLIVAAAASYTAVELAARLSVAKGRSSLLWLLGGALAMGTGVWAAHLIGMLAFHPPVPGNQEIAINAVPWLIAVGVAGIALFAVRSPTLKLSHATVGATLMGAGIGSVHYTGMAVAQFALGGVHLAVDGAGALHSHTLGVLLGVATLGILSITLVISAIDAQYQANVVRLTDTLQAANEQLRNVARYDILTGLPNRLLLDDRITQAMSRADRSRTQFTVMFVDLDRFKPVNDNFGHVAGDKVLRVVALRLQSCVRRDDTVARAGGDEFVIVLNETGGAGDVSAIGRKILEALARPMHVDRHEVHISCSIGITVYPTDGQDMNTLIVNADRAMYCAKAGGGNNYRFFAPEMSEVAAGFPVTSHGTRLS